MNKLTLKQVIMTIAFTVLIGIISSVLASGSLWEHPSVAPMIVNCPMQPLRETNAWQDDLQFLAQYPGWPFPYLEAQIADPIVAACSPADYKIKTQKFAGDVAVWFLLAVLLTAAIERRPWKRKR